MSALKLMTFAVFICMFILIQGFSASDVVNPEDDVLIPREVAFNGGEEWMNLGRRELRVSWIPWKPPSPQPNRRISSNYNGPPPQSRI